MVRKSKRAAVKRRKKRGAKSKHGTKPELDRTVQKAQVDDRTDVRTADQLEQISDEDELVVEEEVVGDVASAEPHGEGKPPHDN